MSTNSETTSATARQQWSDAFGVPVLDEYSSEEAGLLAYECPHWTAHLIEDDSHVDVVAADADGIGQVLTTDLWNRSLPIIRYEQGDEAGMPTFGGCECGVGFRALGRVEGRRDDSLWSTVRGRIHSDVLLELTENLLGGTDLFRAYRVVQTADTVIDLLLVAHQDTRVPESVIEASRDRQAAGGAPVSGISDRVVIVVERYIH